MNSNTVKPQPDNPTGETGSLHCSMMPRQRIQTQSDQPDDPTGETVCIVVCDAKAENTE